MGIATSREVEPRPWLNEVPAALSISASSLKNFDKVIKRGSPGDHPSRIDYKVMSWAPSVLSRSRQTAPGSVDILFYSRPALQPPRSVPSSTTRPDPLGSY